MNDQPGAPEPLLSTSQAALLAQLRTLIQRLDEIQYRQPARRLPDSTFGRQVRHCLDHFLQFIAGLELGTIDYAARGREALLERDPARALACLDLIEQRLRRLEPLNRSLLLRLDDGATVPTSVGRELEFLSSHTVHHLAVLGLLARELGVEVPATIGVACSTLAHRAATGR